MIVIPAKAGTQQPPRVGAAIDSFTVNDVHKMSFALADARALGSRFRGNDKFVLVETL
ncbi:MAG TPA: hypothetical protein VHX61_04365 [Rhizomicrobium sp.]|nr:hypothetical protein [Rhizomicrobium sp.]